MNVLPTGTCFDDALEYFEHLNRERDERVFELYLCHGICVAPDGHDYAHAWVETKDGREAIGCGYIPSVDPDAKAYYTTTRDDFYKEFKVKDVTRYSVRQAAILNLTTGHFGPWLQKYRDLCKNQRRKHEADLHHRSTSGM